jgi:3-methylfumaryl-CoA hydratase
VFVDVERTVSQMGKARVCERQTIVYRDAGEATPAVQAIRTDAGEDGEMWRPESTDLFRFSAATFNTHRIHYDEPYAREVEGHPALVVQGPFIAAKLAGFARRQAGQALAQFSFRAHAPAMVNQPIRIGMGRTGGEVAATRCDGVIAMTGAFSTEGA